MKVIDLTHTINENTPSWPSAGRPTGYSTTTMATVAKHGYYSRVITTPEHYATHIDAPAHFVAKGKMLADLPVANFVAPVVVIDCRNDVRRNADYQLSPEKLRQFEKINRKIAKGSIVICHTGWAARWPNVKRYLNMRHGNSAKHMHFPGFSPAATRILVQRGAVGIGIDTLSIDAGQNLDFEAHHIALGAGLYQLENLTNLDKIPKVGATLIVAPMKLAKGSGGPCRVFALLPKKR